MSVVDLVQFININFPPESPIALAIVHRSVVDFVAGILIVAPVLAIVHKSVVDFIHFPLYFAPIVTETVYLIYLTTKNHEVLFLNGIFYGKLAGSYVSLLFGG